MHGIPLCLSRRFLSSITLYGISVYGDALWAADKGLVTPAVASLTPDALSGEELLSEGVVAAQTRGFPPWPRPP